MRRPWLALLLCLGSLPALRAQNGRSDVGEHPASGTALLGTRLALVIVSDRTARTPFADRWIRQEGVELCRRLVEHGFHVRRLDLATHAALDATTVRAELARLLRIADRGDCVFVGFVGYGAHTRGRVRGALDLAREAPREDAALRLAQLDQAYWDTRATKVLTYAHVYDAEATVSPAPDALHSLRAQAGRDWLVGFETPASLDAGRDATGRAQVGSPFANAFRAACGTAADHNGDGALTFRETAYAVAADLRRQAFAHDVPSRAELLWHGSDSFDPPWLDLGRTTPGSLIDVASASGGSNRTEGTATAPSTLHRDRRDARRALRANAEERTALEAVEGGIAWLLSQQHESGRWADGAPGAVLYDVGLTGLAALAIQGAGHVHVGRDRAGRSLRRGFDWLLAQQVRGGDDDGLFGTRASHDFIYNHALAALAVVEAFLLTGDAALKEPAQRAVDFAQRARNPYKAWRYAVPPNGENDTSVTGFLVNVLAVARRAGLTVDDLAFEGARTLFDELTDPETGRCGYTARGERPARPVESVGVHPAEASESLTAVALFARTLLGEDPGSRICRAHADLLLRTLPRWSADGATNDLYYWYYGSQALAVAGGEGVTRWRGALRSALLPHRVVGPDVPPADPGEALESMLENAPELGHEPPLGPPPAPCWWNPGGPWSSSGGTLYTTAMALLALEAPLRYPKGL